MTRRPLPPELHWFLDATNRIFPFHLRAVWENDEPVAIHRSFKDGIADDLLASFLRARPQLQESTVARVPIRIQDFAPVVARYALLDLPEWDRAFVFGYVPVPRATIGDYDKTGMDRLALTRREAEVALAVGAGNRLTEVARMQQSSPASTRKLLKSALRKTGCTSQHELAVLVHALLGAD